MRVRSNSFFKAGVMAAFMACSLAPMPSMGQGCEPLTVAGRGDAPNKVSARPLFPRITIEAHGRFCLDRDVHQAAVKDLLRRSEAMAPHEAVIRIRADDVSLDLGGRDVSSAVPNGMTLIWFSRFAAGARSGTRFRGARIVNGNLLSRGTGGIGIDLTASRFYGRHRLEVASIPGGAVTDEFFEDTSHLIEDVRIHAGKHAILIDGKNNVIRNNRIIVDAVTAIVAQGPGVVIENNVIEVRNDLHGFSERDRRWQAKTPFVIRLIQADGAIVRNNEIRLLDRAGGSSLPAAIELVETSGATVEGNILGGIEAPVQADAVSSFRDLGNPIQACPSGATRFLAAREADQAPGQLRPSACR